MGKTNAIKEKQRNTAIHLLTLIQLNTILKFLSNSSKQLAEPVCLFGWFLNVPVNYLAISQTGPRIERLTILRAATHETELGDHDFCLSPSHYSDTDPTRRERAATAGIKPRTSSPGIARSTGWATAPPPPQLNQSRTFCGSLMVPQLWLIF